MTNLEFINEEIERIKELLELDDVLCELSDNDYKFCNDRLKILQQIKNELEIMELIKNGWSSMETTLAGDQIMRFQNLKIDDWVKLWNRLEEILLKKALEVSNEKES